MPAAVMHRVAQLLRREDGFKLLELLIAMTILGVLFTIFSTAVASALRHSHEAQEQDVLQTEVRGAIDHLAQDLRGASVGDGSTPIEAMTSNTIQFLAPDRANAYHLLRIAYRLSSGRLERADALSSNTNGPPWTMPSLSAYELQVDSVKNTVLFTYLDGSGAVTSTPANVRTVTITVAVSTSTSQNRQFTYQTSATVRTSQ